MTAPHISALAYIDPNGEAMWDELREVLERHKAAGRIRVGLAHWHIPQEHGKVLVETTNAADGTHTTQPVLLSEVPEGALPVEWVFDTVAGRWVVAQVCVETTLPDGTTTHL